MKIAPHETEHFLIENAQLWSAESPYLYSVVLYANGEKILQRVGIRTSEIKNGVYKINGRHIKLKGINRHESNPVTGATVTVKDTVQDLKLMKWANVNAIRTSHYPDMPEFYTIENFGRNLQIVDFLTMGFSLAKLNYMKEIKIVPA